MRSPKVDPLDALAGPADDARMRGRMMIGAAWLLAGCTFGNASEPASDDGDDGADEGQTDTADGNGEAEAEAEGDDADAEGDAGEDDDAGDDGSPYGPGPWDHGWAVPAEPQTGGDPAAGFVTLTEGTILTCGVPLSLWGLVSPFLGPLADSQPLPGRTGDNADIPLDWTVHTPDSGVRMVSQNCLQCHAGEFNGELILGLGVADKDFTFNTVDLLDAVPILDLPPGNDLSELLRFFDRLDGLGGNTVMPTIGQNPAEMSAISLVAHRDPITLEWSDDPYFDIPPVPVPLDVPPWWRARKKNALFYNAMARGDHRGTMMLATALCTDTVDEAEAIASQFNNVHAYVRTLPSPKYPFAIDEALAATGKGVYESECAGCHGTYGVAEADDTYPNLLLPLDVIETDPVAAEGGTLWAPQLVSWYNASYYGTITPMVPDDPWPGYIAPPLDGVWATAPFLHNGSVPTIAAVLDSTKRPTYWRRVDYDSTNFDTNNLGWPYAEVASGHDALPEAERKYVYDTTLFAHDNGGHTFGDHLTEHERAAVLEYLKTL